MSGKVRHRSSWSKTELEIANTDHANVIENENNSVMVKEWLNSEYNHILKDTIDSTANNEITETIDPISNNLHDSCSDYGSSETEDSRVQLPVLSDTTWQFSTNHLRSAESHLNKEFKDTLNSPFSDYNAFSSLHCQAKAVPKSRFANLMQRSSLYIKQFTSPDINSFNIRILGSKLEVALQRKRIFESNFIIHPLSSFMYIWDAMMLIALMIYVVTIPLEIAFFDYDTLLPFHILWDIFFILDMFVYFRTGYCIYGERFQLDPKVIANRYLKTWFIVDFISVLPLNYIFMSLYDNQNRGLKVLKIVKVMKLVNIIKLLRLLRLTRIMAQYQEIYRLTVSIARYIKLVSLMLLLAHWNGCLQYFVPMYQDFPEGSWLHLYKLTDEPWYVKYGWSLFKTLSHMLCIGYGRFMPMLLSEAFVTLFTMITGATFYALLITNSVASRVQGTCSRSLFEEKLKGANEFLINQDVPEEIRDKVESYFSRKYPERRYIKENDVLAEMSRPIREGIINYTSKDMIASVPFLKNSPPDLLYGILSKAKTMFYLPGDIVVKEGRLPRDMYFIRSGELVITVKDHLMEKVEDGAYFGEIGVLTKQRRLFTVMATKTSELLVLSKDDFLNVLEDFPKIRTLLQHDSILRMKKLYNQYTYICPEAKKNMKDMYTIPTRHGYVTFEEADFMDLFMKSLKCLVETKYDLERIEDYEDKKIRKKHLDKAIKNILKSHMCSLTCTMCEENDAKVKEETIID